MVMEPITHICKRTHHHKRVAAKGDSMEKQEGEVQDLGPAVTKSDDKKVDNTKSTKQAKDAQTKGAKDAATKVTTK